MFKQLRSMDVCPALFECYSAETLWNDSHISQKMLELHLNPDVEPASRNRVFIEKSAAWMSSRFNLGGGFRVADFGCGPGLYTTRFSEQGAAVTGIDFSERSIAYAEEQARSNGLDIAYHRHNYLDFSIDQKFDLITLIYCDLCPLSPQQRKRLFKVFNRHLEDNGLVFLDVFSLNAFKKRSELATWGYRLMEGFWSEKSYYGFLKTIKYEKEKVILDKYTIVEENRTWEVYNWLQYYSRQALAGELAANGFQVVEYYSDVAGKPFHEDADEIAVVAQKIPEY
ncbi:MAG: class I SAM-dependent methyltransferase [Deltaproteobacteria bacterium]|nr:class I SAM-dependent methyltransferase [Deltaproteobacteria bacterium]